MKKSICVFCGSRYGNQSIYKNVAEEMGILLAKMDIRLVFGGGCVGLMGEVANATISQGGEVLGIIPKVLIEKEVAHDKVTELIVTESLHERKNLMAQKSDAFIVLPGGIGTMEEFFEVYTWNYLGIYHKPIGLLNVGGYYSTLVQFINQMNVSKFLNDSTLDLLVVEESPKELIEQLI